MCRYVLLVLLTVLFVTGIYILTSTKRDHKTKKEAPRDVKKKIRHHIPKIMLDLYENRKNFGNFSRADVVRSLIPKMAGEHITEHKFATEFSVSIEF